MSENNNSIPIYLDPEKRHEFVLLFDVKDGNPNGNPDAGNLPRIDPETGHGIVTDVSVKRKVRDYVDRELEIPIFIQSEFALNSLIIGAAREVKVEPPHAEVEDDELFDWLESNVPEEFERDGREFSYQGTDFNKKAVNDNFKKLYKEQTTEIGNKIKELIKTLKKRNRVPIEDEELLEFLQGREGMPIRIEDGYAICDGEFSNDQEKQLMGMLKAMEKKISEFVAQMDRAAKGKLDKDDREKVRYHMIKKYFDIRMFGAVLSTGINAGQVRGPMQIKFGRSIDPVVPLDHSITRCAITKSEDFLRKETEMARKPNIAYGLYRVHGYYNPSLARRKKPVEKDKWEWEPYVRENDLEVLWEALEYMFEKHSASSAAAGEQATMGLWIFSHDNPKGNAHAHKLFDLIKVPPCAEGKEPRKFEDYAARMEYPGKGDDTNTPTPQSLESKGFPGVWVTHMV
ncbi:MAG: type I CRISPR-associated protein Cas7 [Desulfobacterales bacterium]|nr:type I CRISPR-associated protein Cas7 [Desulfobacterales bacterium]